MPLGVLAFRHVMVRFSRDIPYGFQVVFAFYEEINLKQHAGLLMTAEPESKLSVCAISFANRFWLGFFDEKTA